MENHRSNRNRRTKFVDCEQLSFCFPQEKEQPSPLVQDLPFPEDKVKTLLQKAKTTKNTFQAEEGDERISFYHH